jgi:hypothetical protein
MPSSGPRASSAAVISCRLIPIVAAFMPPKTGMAPARITVAAVAKFVFVGARILLPWTLAAKSMASRTEVPEFSEIAC